MTTNKVGEQPLGDAHVSGESRWQLVDREKPGGFHFIGVDIDLATDVLRSESQHQGVGKWPRLAIEIAHSVDGDARLLEHFTHDCSLCALAGLNKPRKHAENSGRKVGRAAKEDFIATLHGDDNRGG